MKATELRIGNLVYADTGMLCLDTHTVLAQDIVDIQSHESVIAKPIPLTEEWLLKFGFVKLPTGEFKITHPNDMFDYILDELGGEWHTAIDQDQEGLEWYAFSWGIKYVHQLQNLYFALTGNELTISE